MLNGTLSLRCPICENYLLPTADGKSYGCEKQHHFDLAKQGYLNLLPPHHKGSKNPGDSKEMVSARRLFLAQGFYAPVAQSISEQLVTFMDAGEAYFSEHKTIRVLDLGCGEGYYSSQVRHNLSTYVSPSLEFYGIDVSKEAIRAASPVQMGQLDCWK